MRGGSKQARSTKDLIRLGDGGNAREERGMGETRAKLGGAEDDLSSRGRQKSLGQAVAGRESKVEKM